jgi:hypothetical protein
VKNHRSVLRSVRTTVVLALGLAVAGTASAVESWHQDHVKWVYPQANGNFILVFNTSPANCPNPGNPKYFYVSLGVNGVTAEGLKAMLATALMAYGSGKMLSVAFETASSSCDVNRLYVSD